MRYTRENEGRGAVLHHIIDMFEVTLDIERRVDILHINVSKENIIKALDKYQFEKAGITNIKVYLPKSFEVTAKYEDYVSRQFKGYKEEYINE